MNNAIIGHFVLGVEESIYPLISMFGETSDRRGIAVVGMEEIYFAEVSHMVRVMESLGIIGRKLNGVKGFRSLQSAMEYYWKSECIKLAAERTNAKLEDELLTKYSLPCIRYCVMAVRSDWASMVKGLLKVLTGTNASVESPFTGPRTSKELWFKKFDEMFKLKEFFARLTPPGEPAPSLETFRQRIVEEVLRQRLLPDESQGA